MLFLVNDSALASDNALRFSRNLLGRIYKKLMIRYEIKNYNMVLTEKQ